MITYEPFFNTIKQKNISTYKLVNTYGLSRSLLDRLKHNKPITTVTINDLCTILDCKVQDILIYKKDWFSIFLMILGNLYWLLHRQVRIL